MVIAQNQNLVFILMITNETQELGTLKLVHRYVITTPTNYVHVLSTSQHFKIFGSGWLKRIYIRTTTIRLIVVLAVWSGISQGPSTTRGAQCT